MRFEPKTPEQLAEERLSRLLPEGWLPTFVISAKDDISKKGNDMWVIDNQFIHPHTSAIINVRDYVTNNMHEKIFGIAEAFGLKDKYQSGNIEASDLEEKRAYAFIKIRPAQNGYGPSNMIGDYISEARYKEMMKNDENGSANHQPKSSTQGVKLDDDIPFF